MEKNKELSIAVNNEMGFQMNPKTFDETMKFCELISKSDLVPNEFKGKVGNVFVAIQMGLDVGLRPLQALQSVAIVNGKPSLYGDAVMAIVRASGTAEYIEETWDDKAQAATCKAKRRGDPKEIVRTFSMEDAKKAGLAGKSGTWQNYPKRMAQMRARSWVLRDGWADYLKGISIAEEAQDIAVESKPEISMPKAIQAEVIPSPKTENPIPDQDLMSAALKSSETTPIAVNVSDEIKTISATVTRLTKNKIKNKEGVERTRVLLHCMSAGKECFFGIYDNDGMANQVKESVNAGAASMDIHYKTTADWGNEIVNVEATF